MVIAVRIMLGRTAWVDYGWIESLFSDNSSPARLESKTGEDEASMGGQPAAAVQPKY